MKGQDKSPEKQTDKVEICNLPEKGFRIMIVKMIQDVRKRMEAKIEKIQEMFTKDLEELKNKQTEMNNTNTLDRIKHRITEAEEWISDLEDRMIEINAAKWNIGKRMKRNEDSQRDLWDNIKCTNVRISTFNAEEVPEGEEREKGPEKIFEEIVAKTFPNMGKVIVNQVQEAQSPRKDKPKEEHTKTHNQTDKN